MSYLVVFRSTRKLDDGLLYSEWSEKMEDLVTTIDGYEKHFGFRDQPLHPGQGLTDELFVCVQE